MAPVGGVTRARHSIQWANTSGSWGNTSYCQVSPREWGLAPYARNARAYNSKESIREGGQRMIPPRLLLFPDDGIGQEFVVIDTKGLTDDELEDEYGEAPIKMIVLQIAPVHLNKWPINIELNVQG